MTRRLALAALVASVACAAPPRPADAAPPPDAGPDAAPAFAYPPGTTTLLVRRAATVRSAPGATAPPVGLVEADARLGYRGLAPGDADCPAWVEVTAADAAGWVCSRSLVPTDKPPGGREWPSVPDGGLVPFDYGVVVGEEVPVYRRPREITRKKPRRTITGAVKVRRAGLVDVDGLSFWKTGAGDLIPAESVESIRPSRFAGVLLGEKGPRLPFAFVVAAAGGPVPVRAAPDPGAAVVAEIRPRRTAPAYPAGRKGWENVGDGWVPSPDAHVVALAPPPPGLLRADERWIDVDLDEQVLVAYAGTQPVYATLISSGRVPDRTPTGVYRIWLKIAVQDMDGTVRREGADEESYSVEAVPWSQFFAFNLALHTAYWHDDFGLPKSHGCVNLAPRDARWLYGFTAPAVPPGWSAVYGSAAHPGTLVRVRSHDDPAPALQGYAKEMVPDAGLPP